PPRGPAEDPAARAADRRRQLGPAMGGQVSGVPGRRGASRTMTMAEERTPLRKTRVGTVVSDKNDKTIVVSVERAARHRLYHKVIRRTKKYHAHDANNSASLGDLVRIE